MEVNGENGNGEEESPFVVLSGGEGGVTPGEQLVLPFIPVILDYLDTCIWQHGGKNRNGEGKIPSWCLVHVHVRTCHVCNTCVCVCVVCVVLCDYYCVYVIHAISFYTFRISRYVSDSQQTSLLVDLLLSFLLHPGKKYKVWGLDHITHMCQMALLVLCRGMKWTFS